MKTEALSFIDHAETVLSRADTMLTVNLNEDAARAAYLACFHIAQAYILQRTDEISKSHKGVQIEFFRLTKSDTRVDTELRKFLSSSYDFKSVADYFTGPNPTISHAEAVQAVAKAKRFVAHFRELVPTQ